MKARILFVILLLAIIGGAATYIGKVYVNPAPEQVLQQADWRFRHGDFEKARSMLNDLLKEMPHYSEARLKLVQVMLSEPTPLVRRWGVARKQEEEQQKQTQKEDHSRSDALFQQIAEYYAPACTAYYAAMKADPLVVTSGIFDEFIAAVPDTDVLALWLKQASAQPAHAALAQHLGAMHLAASIRRANGTYGEKPEARLDKSAEDYLALALAAEPDFTAARLSLAKVQIDKGEIDAGIALLRAVADGSDSTGMLLYTAEQMARFGRIQPAQPYIEKTLQKAPESGRAKLLQAALQFEKGQYDQAQKTLAAVSDNYRHNAVFLLMQGYLTLAADRADKAVDALSAADAQHPHDPLIAYVRGLADFQAGLTVEAAVLLDNSAAVFPEARLARAALDLQINRPKQAAEACKLALQNDKNDADAWRLLAAAYINVDDAGKALQALNRLIELRPDSAVARQAQAAARFALCNDDPERAQKLAQIAADYQDPSVGRLAARLSGRADAPGDPSADAFVRNVYFLLMQGDDYARIAAEMLLTDTAAPPVRTLLEQKLPQYTGGAVALADYSNQKTMAALAHKQPDVLILLNHAVVVNRQTAAAACAEQMLDLKNLWKDRLMAALAGRTIEWPFE